ncbi:MAG TPA: hypothetical protein VGG39_28040 [Polyangiaceae bacterium]|jgi:hypothetical protein
MPRPSSPSTSVFAAAAAALAAAVVLGAPSRAYAQACCAGGAAVTPGRLELHEDALVGATIKAAYSLGSYDTGGRFVSTPRGDGEGDFEQDLFGAVRFLGHGQGALLVPLVETDRRDPIDGNHFGGGVGDVNLSGRWDFVEAGAARYFPGVALLAGITFPTGKPPEQATPPLAVDATGIGAYQINGALALEQTFGPWLVNATGIVAVRTPHVGEELAPQVTLLGAAAYTLPSDVAFSLSVAYAFEGDAHLTSGGAVPDSSKRATTLTFAALWPFSDAWRVLGGFTLNPPVGAVGSNQPAAAGLTLTVIRSWT